MKNSNGTPRESIGNMGEYIDLPDCTGYKE
jgi:hypothetical protein